MGLKSFRHGSFDPTGLGRSFSGGLTIEVGEYPVLGIARHQTINITDDLGERVVEINGLATAKNGDSRAVGIGIRGDKINAYIDTENVLHDQTIVRTRTVIGTIPAENAEQALSVVLAIMIAINTLNKSYHVGYTNSNTVAAEVLKALGFTTEQIVDTLEGWAPGTHLSLFTDEQRASIVDFFSDVPIDDLNRVKSIEFTDDDVMAVSVKSGGSWVEGGWDTDGNGVSDFNDHPHTAIDPPRPRPDREYSTQVTVDDSSEADVSSKSIESTDSDRDDAQPLVIDLDGYGVSFTADRQTLFDFDGDSYLERTSWVAPGDGFLVIDLQSNGTRAQNADGTYGDGQIDQAREIAFALWGADGMTDLQALAEAVDEDGNKIFDSNGDGVLNSADDVWDELRIWQDANSNGVVDDDELMTLDQVTITQRDANGVETGTKTGITEINLGYDDGSAYDDETDDTTVFGNTLHGLASLTVGGTTIAGAVGDVSLSYNSLGWKIVGTQGVDGEYIGDWYVEFESGDHYDYHNLTGSGTTIVDLTTDWLDGATGDDRANVLNAASSTKSVVISGHDGADTLTGGNNDDMLSGDKGADVLRGNAGNDVLFVDAQDTVIKGGTGYDTVIAVDYEELDANGDLITPDGITLDLFDSDINVSAELEAVYGNAGNDVLDGSDTPWQVALYGGAGSDILTGGQSGDILSGDEGNDTVTASEGDDFVTGGNGEDSLQGGNGDDFIMGGEGHDSINGGNGDDYVMGGDNADTIDAGNGDDYVAGDKGHDSIDGGSGDDRLYGGLDNDTLADGAGDDHLEGGRGNDQFIMSAVSGISSYDVVFGGKGTDTIKLKGSRSDWTWTSVFYVENQIVGYGGQDGDEPIFASVDRGVQQYRLTNGKAFIEIQDVEVLDFEIGADQVLSAVASNVDSSDSYSRSNTGYTADTMLSHLNWLAGNGDDTALSAVTVDLTGTPIGAYETYYYAAGDDTFAGLAGNDALAAGAGNDLVKGGTGSDVLSGDAGNDTLNGSTGSDAIFGGDGMDTINGASGSDRIDGGNGDDSISGGFGGDYISGGLGDDNVSGGSGSDLIGGEEGNDTLMGDGGEDRLYGGDGDDVLDGGISNDSLYGGIGLDTLTGDYGDDLLVGGDGADKLFGGHGFDLMYGGDDADLMQGGGFDDVLYGGDGDDTLKGDEGADFLEGGAGADVIRGGVGLRDVASYANSDAKVIASLSMDDITGGTGIGGHAEGDTLFGIESLLGSRYADNLTGNNDSNTLSGGAGHDVLNSGAGNDYVYGGSGEDSLQGGDGIDRLYGGFESDYLNGGAGDDQLFGGIEDETQKTVPLDITNGSFAADTLAVGAVIGMPAGWAWVSGGVSTRNASETWFTTGSMNGPDRNYVWLDENAGIKQNISTGISADERFTVAVDVGKQKDWAFTSSYKIELRIGGMVVKDFEGIVQNDDTFETVYISLDGDTLDNAQTGQTITLTISGTNNSRLAIDNVRYILDDDTLNGGVGNDELYGGIGNDILSGGAGNDKLYGGNGNDTIYASTIDNDASKWGFDTAYGGTGNDQIIGGNGRSFLYGGTGDDILNGGDDWRSADIDKLYGGDGNDILISGFVGADRDIYLDKGDQLFGGNGADTLTGGNAHDILSGGAGNDVMTGGSGNDTFIFQANHGADVITDFQVDLDKIDLSSLGVTWAGKGTSWSITSNGGNAKIIYDGADNVILTGVAASALTESDFIFA